MQNFINDAFTLLVPTGFHLCSIVACDIGSSPTCVRYRYSRDPQPCLLACFGRPPYCFVFGNCTARHYVCASQWKSHSRHRWKADSARQPDAITNLGNEPGRGTMHLTATSKHDLDAVLAARAEARDKQNTTALGAMPPSPTFHRTGKTCPSWKLDGQPYAPASRAGSARQPPLDASLYTMSFVRNDMAVAAARAPRAPRDRTQRPYVGDENMQWWKEGMGVDAPTVVGGAGDGARDDDSARRRPPPLGDDRTYRTARATPPSAAPHLTYTSDYKRNFNAEATAATQPLLASDAATTAVPPRVVHRAPPEAITWWKEGMGVEPTPPASFMFDTYLR